MFANIGNKIKGYVKTVFYINLVVTLLLVLLVTYYAFDVYEYIWAFVALFAGVLYMLTVYLSLMCLYAFGEMTQNTAEQTTILRKLAGISDEPKKPEPSKENRCKACGKEIDKDVEFCRFCGAATKGVPVPAPTPSPAPEPTPAPTPRKAVCPHCGAKQMEGTVTCKYCGTAMK